MNSQWIIGILLLGVVVVLWVASGFLVSAMRDDYMKPYFITYFNTSLMALYLPLGFKKQNIKKSKFTIRQTAWLSFIFFVLWFTSNLLCNASYYYTTVQSATIISCFSSFFTLLVGAYFKVEAFSFSKLVPLTISALGIILITSQDSQKITAPPNAFKGNILAFCSAFFYGVYTTLLKKQVGDESNLNTKMFFGFVGIFTIFSLWPMLILLNYFGVEKFSLPPTSKVWILMLVNGLSIIVSDFCWVLSTLMTSPLVVSVGLGATIPLSILGEVVLHGRYVNHLYLVGALCVLLSFYSINKIEVNDEAERSHSRHNSEVQNLLHGDAEFNIIDANHDHQN